MGGAGSGRKPDPLKFLKDKQEIISTGSDTFNIPNYSGVKGYDDKLKVRNFTDGSVLFAKNQKIEEDNSNLFWDATNNRLGIGTTSPATEIHVEASNPALTIKATGTGGTNNASIILNNEGIEKGSLSYSESSDILLLTAGYSDIGLHASNAIRLYVYSGGWIPGIYINSAGNVGIGTSSPTKPLEVNGDVLIDDMWGDDISGNRFTYTETTGGSARGIFSYKDDDGIHLAPRDTDDTANHNLILVPYAYWNSDFDHNPASTNPTFFIHSATNPDTDNTQYLQLYHDQTDAIINTGKGKIKLNNNTIIPAGKYIYSYNQTPAAGALLGVTDDANPDVEMGDVDNAYDQVWIYQNGTKALNIQASEIIFTGRHLRAGYDVGLNGQTGSTLGLRRGSANLNDLGICANSVEMIYLDGSESKVGIGTNSPTTKLHLTSGALTMDNDTTQPSTPTGAGTLYVSGGALWYIGSSGTTTKIADA